MILGQSLFLNAQIDANWILRDNVLLSFSSNGPIVGSFDNYIRLYNCTVSDENGNLLFYSGNQTDNFFYVFDSNNNVITSLDIDLMYFSKINSVVYQFGDKYYLFFSYVNVLYTFVLSKNNEGKIVLEKSITTPKKHNFFSPFLFPFENDNGSLMLLVYQSPYFVTYTFDGANWKISWEYQYTLDDNLFSDLSRISVKSNLSKGKILVSKTNCLYDIDIDLNSGKIKQVFPISVPNLRCIEFSESKKYLYMLLKDNDMINLYCYGQDFFEDYNLNKKIKMFSDSLAEYLLYTDMLLGPDGNIYIGYIGYRYLSRICNSDTDNSFYQKDVIDLGEDKTMGLHFPSVLNNCINSIRPKAQFDNSMVCYEEPLNVLLDGTAPFSIEYKIDENLCKKDNIYSNTFEMPNISGKYLLMKITDKNCSYNPQENNIATRANKMNKLIIKSR